MIYRPSPIICSTDSSMFTPDYAYASVMAYRIDGHIEKIKCEHCGVTITVDEEKDDYVCTRCGAPLILEEE